MGLATTWPTRHKHNWYKPPQEQSAVACTVHGDHTLWESYAKVFNQRRQESYAQAFLSLLTQEIRDVYVPARVVKAEPSLEQRFIEQANKWQRETEHLSSPLQRMMHSSYQAILGMGAEHKQDIVRLMLRDMQTTRRDWLLALSYLTQANPVNPKDAGKIDKLIATWVKWGKEQGLLHS